MAAQHLTLHNPHLEGDSFFWKSGPVGVLLFHGFTATTAEVRPLADYLATQGYSVSAPLLPGHGESPLILNATSWHEWTETAEEQYLELTDHCDQVFVGGESLGSLLALYLAAKYRDIRGVIGFAPAIKLNISLWEHLMLRLHAPFKLAVPKSSLDEDLLWQGYKVNPLKGVRQLLHFQKVVKRLLPSITQPVLLVMAKHDHVITADSAEIVYRGLGSTDKRILNLEHSRHILLLDSEFELVADAVMTFLSRLQREESATG